MTEKKGGAAYPIDQRSNAKRRRAPAASFPKGRAARTSAQRPVRPDEATKRALPPHGRWRHGRHPSNGVAMLPERLHGIEHQQTGRDRVGGEWGHVLLVQTDRRGVDGQIDLGQGCRQNGRTPMARRQFPSRGTGARKAAASVRAFSKVRLTSSKRGQPARTHCAARACPAPPPAPRINTRKSRNSALKSARIARSKPGPSVLKPCNRLSAFTRTVLTAPKAAACASTSSSRGNAATLWGMVRLTPMNPAWAIRRSASASSSDRICSRV